MRRPLAAALLIAVAAACAAPSPLDHPPVRLEGFNVAGRPIRSASAEAQAWFDQGLTLVWAAQRDEAVRSFAAATRADPTCAMAWWGLALASGPHLDDERRDVEAERRAHAAIQRALALRDGAAPVDVALIEALAARFAWPPPEDRTPLDEAYAAALRELHQRVPDDPDVAALFAEALLLIQPPSPWPPEGGPDVLTFTPTCATPPEFRPTEEEPVGTLDEAVSVLERARSAHPDHLGLGHLLLHAVTAEWPERGERAAARLVAALPDAGHLLHMVARLDLRLGRYADAVERSERALAADQAYLAAAADPGAYLVQVARHRQTLVFAAMMDGREALARDAAERLVDGVPEVFARRAPELVDGLLATPLQVAVRFGRWEDVLAAPEPPEWRPLSRAVWLHARCLALCAAGRMDEALAAWLAFMLEATDAVPRDWRAGTHDARQVLTLGSMVLAGECTWQVGETEDALEILRWAVRLEDALGHDLPPGWLVPVRHTLGAHLMADGRHAEAEQVYRDDLQRHPRNGWSLLGLMQALSAQGLHGPAQTVSRWLGEAWERADTRATSSSFLAPGPIER